MSGRVRVTLGDGRRVTGFRKTLRRNQRTRPQDRPDLRLTFMLPQVLGFSTVPGEYPGNITVDADSLVTARGNDREWVLRKAGEFLRSIAVGLTLDPITACLFCPGYPGPTASAPYRPGYRDTYEITVATDRPAVVISRTGMKPLVVTA
jgi:hypothetical protein